MPWHAHLDLQYRRDPSGQTLLRHRHSGPLRIFKSLYPEGPAVCHNVIVHPPGGLVQGDRLEIDVAVAAGAHALVSTPGATRFYRNASGEPAEQRVRLVLEEGARLEWLPLETLAYDGCRALNRVELALAPGAELLAWDVVSLGLPAAGLPFASGCLEQQWDWPGVWLERARLDAADLRLLRSPVGLDGQSALATLVLAAEHLGDVTYLHTSLAGQASLIARTDPENPLVIGDAAYLRVPQQRAHLFDANGSALPRLA